MRRIAILLLAAALTTTISCFSARSTSSRPTYPASELEPLTETIHGHQIADPYRWLEDSSSAETRSWIEAQNTLSSTYLDGVPGRAQIEQTVEVLSRTGSAGMPFVRGDRMIFTFRKSNEEFPSAYVVIGKDAAPKRLSLENESGEELHRGLRLLDISPSGTFLAYSPGAATDEKAVCFLDLTTGKKIGECLPKARYFSVGLSQDTAFYSRATTNGPRVFSRALKDRNDQETSLFGTEADANQLLFSTVSSNGAYLFLSIYHGASGEQTDLFVKDLRDSSPIRPVVVSAGHSDFVDAVVDRSGHDLLVIQSAADTANGGIFITPADSPDPARWRRVLAVPPSTSVHDVVVAGQQLVVGYLEDLHSRLEVVDLFSAERREIPVPVVGSVTALAGGQGNRFFFAFQSLNAPTSIYEVDLGRFESNVWATSTTLQDQNELTVEQVWFDSADRTKVPMFLLYRKGTPRDGSPRALLTGYGAFGVSQTPAFSVLGLAWARLGGVYAVSCVRGGGELGEKWHAAGMGEHKQNTFDDFVAAAEFLTVHRYTSRSRLGIWGGSAGGLLVGAAVTQHPHFFGAAVASYPLLDMLRYDRFLAGRFWTSEYGSAENAAEFETLLRYSPYQNVRKGERYPAMLFITSDSDSRVAPLHSMKMTAKMQSDAANDSGPILLRLYRDVGHSGLGQGTEQQVRMWTDVITFLQSQLR